MQRFGHALAHTAAPAACQPAQPADSRGHQHRNRNPIHERHSQPRGISRADL
jgi:hypothetical protein